MDVAAAEITLPAGIPSAGLYALPKPNAPHPAKLERAWPVTVHGPVQEVRLRRYSTSALLAGESDAAVAIPQPAQWPRKSCIRRRSARSTEVPRPDVEWGRRGDVKLTPTTSASTGSALGHGRALFGRDQLPELSLVPFLSALFAFLARSLGSLGLAMRMLRTGRNRHQREGHLVSALRPARLFAATRQPEPQADNWPLTEVQLLGDQLPRFREITAFPCRLATKGHSVRALPGWRDAPPPAHSASARIVDPVRQCRWRAGRDHSHSIVAGGLLLMS